MLILLVQIASALDTEIKIKTLPDHKVMISALNLDGAYSLIKSFHENSGESGEVSVILSSTVDSFNIAVWVKQDNHVIVYEKFENGYPSGTPVLLELYPDWYVKPVEEIENVSLEENNTNSSENTTIVNETEMIEEEQENNQITGFSIFGEQGFLSDKKFYYVTGIIILLVIGFMIVKKIKNKSKIPKEIKIRKLSEVFTKKEDNNRNNNNESNNEGNNKRIEDAERKIKEAQEEIRQIKNQGKIQEAKKKLIEDQKELMRLREGKE